MYGFRYLVLVFACALFGECVDASPVIFSLEIPLLDKGSWEFHKGPDGRLETGKAISKKNVATQGLQWIEFRFLRKEIEKGIGCTVFLDYADDDNYSYCRLSFSKNRHYDVHFGQEIAGKYRELLHHQATHPQRGTTDFTLTYAVSHNRAHIQWHFGRAVNMYHEDIVPTGGTKLGYLISNKFLAIKRVTLLYDRPQK